MRVMLTGAAGQVGVEMARSLAGRAEVAAFDRARLDLADADALAARVREVRPHVIVNAAAYTAVDRAEQELDAARAINARAPGILAEEARRLGALLVHFSTDYVFDGTKAQPYLETDATAPVNAYGLSKLEGEQAVRAAGCDQLVLRTSWVYGPHGRNFMLTMLKLGATRPELRVVNDQRGAPTSSRQIAAGVMRLLGCTAEAPVMTASGLERARAAGGLYHFSAAGETTWFDFAREIFAARARSSGRAFTEPRLIAIPSSEFPTPARRPANSVLSNARMQSAFGFALAPWERGLEEALSALGG
jgi:dTDP-4-dehydrorhamnose reductase